MYTMMRKVIKKYGALQDFHLAKRHYDLAMETNSEAYLPGILSLIKLHIRSFWHTLMGGKGGLKLWTSDEDDTGELPLYVGDVKSKLTLDFIEVFSGQKNAEGRELDGRQDDGSSEGGEGEGDNEGLSEEEDGPWYMGKARDEFHKRRRGNRETTRSRGEEEDPIEVCHSSASSVVLSHAGSKSSGQGNGEMLKENETAISVPKIISRAR
jgi:SEL1 protein